MYDFVEGLLHAELGCCQGTCRDVLQAEHLGFLVLGRLDDEDNGLLNVLDEPYQNEGVDGVEQGVEHGKSIECSHALGGVRSANGKALGRGVGQTEYGGGDEAYQAKERLVESQCPKYAEHIEYGVRHGGTLCLGVTHRCGYVGGDGGTYVLAQHHGACHLKGYPSHAEHDEGDGHGGRG